jgi:hypothetical protein
MNPAVFIGAFPLALELFDRSWRRLYDLARESGVSLCTIHRAEAANGETAMTLANRRYP